MMRKHNSVKILGMPKKGGDWYEENSRSLKLANHPLAEPLPSGDKRPHKLVVLCVKEETVW